MVTMYIMLAFYHTMMVDSLVPMHYVKICCLCMFVVVYKGIISCIMWVCSVPCVIPTAVQPHKNKSKEFKRKT